MTGYAWTLARARLGLRHHMNTAYILVITDNLNDTTDIISVHLSLTAALKAMKHTAANDGSYRVCWHKDEDLPWWSSDEQLLEIQVHPIS